jgi:hypothetical protein
MEENPELSRMLQDPETLRTMSRAATNPEMMRELMRHNDVALRNIESLPGGFDALRRVYETVQAPLEEGLRDSTSGGVTGTVTSTPAVPSAVPLPNPWARSPPAPSTAGTSPFMPFGSPTGANPFAAMFGQGFPSTSGAIRCNPGAPTDAVVSILPSVFPPFSSLSTTSRCCVAGSPATAPAPAPSPAPASNPFGGAANPFAMFGGLGGTAKVLNNSQS